MRTVYDLDLSNDGCFTNVPNGFYEAALELLNPYEERVFHYLVRRTRGFPQSQIHYQKLAAIAEKCRLNIKTVRSAMQKLVDVRLINRARYYERDVWHFSLNLDWCEHQLPEKVIHTTSGVIHKPTVPRYPRVPPRGTLKPTVPRYPNKANRINENFNKSENENFESSGERDVGQHQGDDDVDKTDIRSLFKKAYPTKEEEIEAIKKWAPGFDLALDLFSAKEVAIDNWWNENQYNEQAIKDYLDILCLD